MQCGVPHAAHFQFRWGGRGRGFRQVAFRASDAYTVHRFFASLSLPYPLLCLIPSSYIIYFVPYFVML
jgi:hypothetical protein